MSPSMIAGLIAMARQDESPQERDIARAKLEAAGIEWREPQPRPATVFVWSVTTTGNAVVTNFRWGNGSTS